MNPMKKATKSGAWSREQRRAILKSVGIGVLLLLTVISAMIGAGTVFLSTVLAAWIFFPILVGPRNAIDAGCLFTMIALGVAVVVSVAQNSPGSLLP